MTELFRVTIGELLAEKRRELGAHEAVVYPDRSLRYSYEDFFHATEQVAKAFIALGFQKGDHIAVWASNVPEWLLLQFGSARAGVVLVTVNTNYRAGELAYLLKQSDAKALFFIEKYKDTDYIETVREVLEKNEHSFPYLKRLILLSNRKEKDFLNWEDFVAHGATVSDHTLKEREASLSPDEVINMQYTSGTTGFPKGVMLTHYNIVNNGYGIAKCMNLTENDRLCIPVPFFHCFGCVLGTLAAFSVGATIVPVEQFDPEVVLRTVEKEKCTALHGVPTMFIAELNLDSFDRYDLSTLRTGIMAGSPCPVEVMKKVMNKMGLTEITIAYGQTESSPVITQTRTDDPIERRVETVGKKLPHVEVKIVDPKSGRTLPPGEQGELCTRGYHVMKGYYKMEEETKKVIDKDGWLHTGDLGSMDEEGYVRITGRLKDMIIRGGENIYPREIEEFLYTHPAVRDVQVVGVPDEKYGEKVAAFIQLQPNEKVTEKEIKQYCEGKIARFKIPEHVFFVDAYPMTASGKIQKYKLRENAKEKIKETKKA